MSVPEIVLAILDGDSVAMRKLFVRHIADARESTVAPELRDALMHELCWALLDDGQEMPVAACHRMEILPGSSFGAGATKYLALSARMAPLQEGDDRRMTLM